MRISGSSYSQTLINRLQNLNASQLKYQEQLSTQQKVNMVSDDPASASKIERLQSQQRESASLRGNLNTASSTLNYSLDSMEFLRNMSQEVLESVSTYFTGDNAEDMDAALKVVEDVLDQTLNVANSKYQNEYLFSGDALSTEPFAVTTDPSGTITAINYQGSTTGTKTFEIGRGMNISPLSDVAGNQSIESFLQGLVTLRDAIIAEDNTAITNSIGVLENADDGLVLAQSDLANKAQRLEVVENLENRLFDSRQNSISKLKDVDLNEVAVKFTQAQQAYQAALQSTSSVLQLSLIDFV